MWLAMPAAPVVNGPSEEKACEGTTTTVYRRLDTFYRRYLSHVATCLNHLQAKHVLQKKPARIGLRCEQPSLQLHCKWVNPYIATQHVHLQVDSSEIFHQEAKQRSIFFFVL